MWTIKGRENAYKQNSNENGSPQTCASSGSLKRCNDDKIESIKYGPCNDLLKKSVEICLQDVRGLSFDPGDSDEDKELIMD